MNYQDQENNKHILVVDDEPSIRDIVCRGLSLHGYNCEAADGSQEAIAAIEAQLPAVVISDINMPGQSGFWLLQQVKSRWADTSVIMLTGVDETQSAVNCLTHGADDYIIKPINLKELALAVGRVLEKRKLVIENKAYQHNLEVLVKQRTKDLHKALEQLNDSYDMTLQALVAGLDAREHETGSHSQRVSMYALCLGKAVDINGHSLPHIARGALLHDIGKLGVSDNILLKPASLTPAEWKMMRRHPEIGYDILKNIEFLRPSLDIVLHHHERFDGDGYPHGLKGNKIPLRARIFMIVDAFDTMTTDRPYRKAMPFESAFQEIRKCSGSQFDPEVVKVFMDIPVLEWRNIRQFTTLK